MNKIEILKQHFKEIAKLNSSEQVWQMPFFAALGVGIVLGLSVFFGKLNYGLIAMIGALSFLYVPNTPLYHRMAVVMCCSFGIVSSFFLGILTHFLPAIFAFIPIGIMAMGSSILIRYYNIGAPGYFFFVFSCVLGAYSPFEAKDFIFLVGLVFLGAMVANLMALLYSIVVIYGFKNALPSEIPPREYIGFDAVFVDSLIMGSFVAFSIFIGTFLEPERSYWIAISCTAIMQGVTLNSIWIKQIQRIIGTALGVCFAWWLLSKQFHDIELILLMMSLFFIGQFLVNRNYALAMIFFTPYATYLSEAANFMSENADKLILARLIDVVIGSILGLLGGFVIYKPYLRVHFERIAKYIFRIKQKA
ncbi:TPA: FUSC family protein [Campylobacter jejuni]|nr:FUSC family protein [Campylobacter jejuni]HED6820353.1 FUSC family protein [Campylobacter jejuni]HEH4642197.1 FUSC family protein [Campylobacter jejuni]